MENPTICQAFTTLRPTSVGPGGFGEGADDYAGTPAHEQVAQFDEMDQTQDGDPDKLAALLYDVVAAGAPLTRLPVGPDAAAATERRVATDAAELAPWRERAMATNLP
ncbi:Rossmann-fold NAD(P)-binding domain-containing protein [Mycolicibacterium litorale]|uniref:Uncharacterized protein n=1 Tax=Mycolicibacterium litorale TaxID=758802 RepID=A0AAD1MXI6_9MYCO|nr:hypothetical protein [Mycolicibacterium litorale]MCV7418453.1 hypothetical protein [Mycolicibacterium litorale]BBY19707.1 hypothetical protein MLIT_52990 [Mycolicibacterium litorale]